MTKDANFAALTLEKDNAIQRNVDLQLIVDHLVSENREALAERDRLMEERREKEAVPASWFGPSKKDQKLIDLTKLVEEQAERIEVAGGLSEQLQSEAEATRSALVNEEEAAKSAENSLSKAQATIISLTVDRDAFQSLLLATQENRRLTKQAAITDDSDLQLDDEHRVAQDRIMNLRNELEECRLAREKG